LKAADFEGEQTYLSDSNLTQSSLVVNANSDDLAAIKDQLKDSLDNATDDGSELQFQIQTATSDMQNAESLTASLEKKLNDERAQLGKNLGGGGGVQQFPFASAINDDFRLGDFSQLTLDAMHGQPRNYDDVQKVVQDLKSLLNGLQIPNEQKLQLQNMLQQLDQLSHQLPIDQQQPDQNFAQALQLLNDLRAALAPFAS
jgi:hypothetical protein